MVVSYTQRKLGYNADITIIISDSKEFNEWAKKVSRDLWDGYWFSRMEVDNTPVNFGAFVTEGEMARHDTDFDLVMMRVEHTKFKSESTKLI